MSDRVGLGFVGVGIWANRLATSLASGGDADIVGCYARTEESRLAFAQAQGCRAAATYEELLTDDDVDGVVIVTPNTAHGSLAVAAARAGKHIYVDKPLTVDYADGRRAVEAAREAGVVFQVGHHSRRWSGVRQARALLDAGELGLVHVLEANYSRPSAFLPRPGWRRDPAEMPLSGMTGYGVHILDIFNYLVGPARRVHAFSKRLAAVSPVDDISVLSIEFESGPYGQLTTSTAIPDQCTFSLHGTGGSVWVEERGSRMLRQGVDELTRTEVDIPPSPDTLLEQLRDYVRCIAEGGQPEVGGAEGLEVVAVMEAAKLSVARGAAVELAEFR